jgi:Lysylphosphatidylglycerol synthase TM region
VDRPSFGFPTFRGGNLLQFEERSIKDKPQHQNPIRGRWTIISIVVALTLGLASLLIFLTPQQIMESFVELKSRDLLYSMAFFFLGCWITVERWRALLSFRAGRRECFHTMGVAHAGNLLIPGRIGEPLRIFLLTRLGVAAEYGTSALVQERLADQMLRVVFLAGTILLIGMSGGGGLASRLVGVSIVTVMMAIALGLLIRHRRAVADKIGDWLGKLPWLKSEAVASYVFRTLTDLSESWVHPGGKKALLWGLLAWLVFAVHTKFILDSFFSANTLAMAFILLAFSPATAPTQPGFFHGLALAALMMAGAEKVPALQAAVVLHMIQMIFLTLWGVFSWVAVQKLIKAYPVGLEGASVRVLE